MAKNEPEPVDTGERNPNSQLGDFAEKRSAEDETTPVQKVTDLEGGAKRDGYFKKRDYEG